MVLSSFETFIKMNDFDIDSVLQDIGKFGPYQRRIYFLLSIPILFVGASNLSYVFIAAKPLYRCFIPHCDFEKNLIHYNASYLPFTIPLNPDGSYNSCQRFFFLNTSSHSNNRKDHLLPFADLSQSTLELSSKSVKIRIVPKDEECVASDFSKMTLEECPEGHVFDDSVYQTSIITEFNLTCHEGGWKAQASQSIYFGGMLAGAFVWGIFSDWVGRRPTILLNLILMAASGVATALVPNLAAFNVARFLNAMASTGVFQTIFVLGLEVVGPQYRVPCAMAWQIVFALGELALGAAGLLVRRWRMLQLVISVPLAAGILYCFVVPESPRWLQSQGRSDEALVVLQSIASANKSRIPSHLLLQPTVSEQGEASAFDNSPIRLDRTDQDQDVQEIDQEVQEIDQAVQVIDQGVQEADQKVLESEQERNQLEPGSLLQGVDNSVAFSNNQLLRCNMDRSNHLLQSKTSLPEILQTPLLGLRLFFFIIIWIVTTLVYYGLSLISAELDSGALSTNAPYISFMLAAMVEVPGYLLALLLQQCWGRRPALVLSLLVAGLACIGAGLVHDFPPINALVASLVGKLGITSAFGAIYLHTAEVFPTGARNAVLGLCSTLARLGGMLAPFSDDLRGVYPPLPLLVFGGLSIGAAACSLVQPETKGTSLPATIDEALLLGRRSGPLGLGDEERSGLLEEEAEEQ